MISGSNKIKELVLLVAQRIRSSRRQHHILKAGTLILCPMLSSSATQHRTEIYRTIELTSGVSWLFDPNASKATVGYVAVVSASHLPKLDTSDSKYVNYFSVRRKVLQLKSIVCMNYHCFIFLSSSCVSGITFSSNRLQHI